jgi:hypothetical protein
MANITMNLTLSKSSIVNEDLLNDIDNTISRISQMGKENPDIRIFKRFEDLEIKTFMFICDKYKLLPRYDSRFEAYFYIGDKIDVFHYIFFQSQIQEINNLIVL